MAVKKSELKAIVADLVAQGCTTRHLGRGTGNGWIIHFPRPAIDGKRSMVIHLTPSDRMATMAMRAEVRRVPGLVWPLDKKSAR